MNNVNRRALALAELIRKRYPFRPSWILCGYRMLTWGLSAATILHVFETLYVQPSRGSV